MAIWGRPSAPTTPTTRRQEKAESMQRQYLWNTPDGDHPDFSETYTHGDEILISWNALNNSIYDLWLTSWGFDADPVALCLARAVNLTHDGNLKLMTSDPPSAQLASKTRYALRFKPPTNQGEYAASDPDLSSPGFVLKTSDSFSQQDVPSTSRVSPTATTATTAPTAFRATPSRGVATSVPEADEPASDMTPGAAAGLTVGLILVVAFVVAMEVAYLMWRRKRRRESEEDGTQASSSQRRLRRLGKGDRGLFVQVDKADKAEMVIDDGVWMMSPELPGDSTWGQRLVHELQGSRLGRGRKPGQALTINSSVVELEAGR